MMKRIALFLSMSIALIAVATVGADAQALKPTWAPNGETLVFYRRQPPNMTIHLLDLQTGTSTPLSDAGTWFHSPRYAPVGDTVYVSGEVEDAPGMFALNTQTGSYKRLGGNTGRVMHPTPSPDGKWLAFDKYMPDENFDLHVMNMTTGDIRQVAATKTSEFHPSWSPDGRFILQDQRKDGMRHVIRIDVATGEITTLASSPDDVSLNHPVYSHDGHYIFSAKGTSIIRMDADGSHEITLYQAGDGWTVFAPALSYDGTRIAFSEITPSYSRGRLMVMDVNGDKPQVVFDDGE